MRNPLLLRLARYTISDTRSPQENFVTEALCHLLDHSRTVGSPFFGRFLQLFHESCDLKEYPKYAIYTQKAFRTTDGRLALPDLTIEREETSCILVEVKIEAAINQYQVSQDEIIDQLENYRRIQTKVPKRVCLLSKYNYGSVPAATARKWYQVAALLERYSASDELELFFTQDFLTYLKEERMSIPKVGYELVNGMSALCNLFEQLEIALEGFKTQKSFGYEWLGYYIMNKKKGQRIAWVGTYYEGRYLTISVEGEELSKKVAGALPEGFRDRDDQGRFHVHSVLDLESSCYFCLEADAQLDLLSKWLAKNLETVEAFS